MMYNFSGIKNIGRGVTRRIVYSGAIVHRDVENNYDINPKGVVVICETEGHFSGFIASTFSGSDITRISRQELLVNDVRFFYVPLHSLDRLHGMQPEKIILYNVLLDRHQFDLIMQRLYAKRGILETIID